MPPVTTKKPSVLSPVQDLSKYGGSKTKTPTATPKPTAPKPPTLPAQSYLYSQLGKAQSMLTAKTGVTPSTLSSKNLNPTTPVNVTQPAPATQMAGLGGVIQSMNKSSKDALATKTANDATTAGTSRKTALDSYLAGLKGTQGEVALTDAEYKNTGVDTAEQEYNDISSQIIAEEQGLQRRLEALDKNTQGLFGGALQQEKDKVERESIAKQADLAVIQMAKLGRYDSAKSIADRAVQAKLEVNKNKLDALKLNYEDNKDLFTTAEKRAFDLVLADRERELDMEAYKEKTRFDQIIEQNDPMYKAKLRESEQSIINAQQNNLIDRAKLGDVNALATLGITPNTSGYLQMDSKEAQSVQKDLINNDAYKAIRKSQDSLQALNAFEELFKEVGTTSGVTSPIENEQLKAKYNASILNLKEFFNLGVLNGPDESILRGVLPDPTSQGFVTNPFAKGGTVSGIQSMKDQVEQTIDDRYLSVKSQYSRYNPADIPVLNDLDRIYLQQKSALNPNVKKFLDENSNMSLEDKLQVINTKF